MYNGDRPIGAAKGKQTNTMASCQPPPPPLWSDKNVKTFLRVRSQRQMTTGRNLEPNELQMCEGFWEDLVQAGLKV